jgi:hypothetical protein
LLGLAVAWRLPRVAMWIVVRAPSRSAEVEQFGDGGGVALAAGDPACSGRRTAARAER